MELAELLRENAAHNLRAFDELKADHESELSKIQRDSYQVITLLVVFQGVIFTAVSQSTLLTCQLFWSPLSLSFLTSLAAFLAIAHKFYSIGELREDIKVASLAISSLQQRLDSIDRSTDLEPPPLQTQPLDRGYYRRNKHAGMRSVFSLNGISSLLFLTFFCVFITVFSIKTLCRHCPRCG